MKNSNRKMLQLYAYAVDISTLGFWGFPIKSSDNYLRSTSYTRKSKQLLATDSRLLTCKVSVK